MAIRQILTYPDAFLRKPTPVWEWETDEKLLLTQYLCLDLIIIDLEETLEASGTGAALAANQVGLPHRLFVTNQLLVQRTAAQMRQTDPLVAERISAIPPVVINPKIVSSKHKVMLDEGCLSFPGFGMKVWRNLEVVVSYETALRSLEGVWRREAVTETYAGFWAQVFQHETDHLDGRLFVDDLPREKRVSIAKFIASQRRSK